MAPAQPDLSLTLPTPGPIGSASSTGRWADLRLRVASAAILLPLGLACLWFAPWSWAVLLAVAAVGMALEWAALCGADRLSASAMGLCLTLLAIDFLLLGGVGGLGLLLLPLGCLVVWLTAADRSRRAALAAGAFYIGLPLVAVVWLRDDRAVGAGNLLFLLLVIWCGDIGAYAAGRWFGGPKLAPAISPGKTWSGAAGGLLASVLAGVATSVVLGGASPWVVPVAVLIAIAGQIGDLVESAIKRWAGVKDSGRSIPGHGGLLDRLDAVLAAAPVAAGLAWWAGPGMYLWR